jgi:hypothetical protein
MSLVSKDTLDTINIAFKYNKYLKAIKLTFNSN